MSIVPQLEHQHFQIKQRFASEILEIRYVFRNVFALQCFVENFDIVPYRFRVQLSIFYGLSSALLDFQINVSERPHIFFWKDDLICRLHCWDVPNFLERAKRDGLHFILKNYNIFI
jgi:hypothetical protein